MNNIITEKERDEMFNKHKKDLIGAILPGGEDGPLYFDGNDFVPTPWDYYCKTIKTHELRSNLADVINRVAYGNEDIILERRDKPLVVMISVKKYQSLSQPAKD